MSFLLLSTKSIFFAGWIKGIIHVILVSAQVLLVLTWGLWTSDLGLTILFLSLKYQSGFEFIMIMFACSKSIYFLPGAEGYIIAYSYQYSYHY